jgi:hypothetical protein
MHKNYKRTAQTRMCFNIFKMALCRGAVCAFYGSIFAYPPCSCIHVWWTNFVVCTVNLILKLSVQFPSSYTPQLTSLGVAWYNFWEKFSQINFCYLTNMQFGNIYGHFRGTIFIWSFNIYIPSYTVTSQIIIL